MAEIKSTMDLVMERAARIGKASSDDLKRGEAQKKGMQLTAEYLDGTTESLTDALAGVEGSMQQAARTGIIESLLRNIILPRDDVQQQRAARAAEGIIEMAGGAGDIKGICSELLRIIGGYLQHREELQGQMEEQIRMQYEQLMSRQGGMGGDEFKIDGSLQAKLREEWDRVEMELNRRYGEALEQNKDNLKQRLGL